jgi:hypothetical protein
MTQAKPDGAKEPARSPKDRRLKLIMAAVVIAAAVAVYMFQLRTPKLKGKWTTDLDEALRQSRQDRRIVLAFFRSDPPNDATKWVIRSSLNHDIVTRARSRHNPLCVSVTVDRALKSEAARKHGLKALPTVIVFSADGKVVKRQSGRVGLGPADVQGMLAEASKESKGQP